MARIITAVTFVVLMVFTTLAFGQQSTSQQITLTIGTFTLSADQLSYDSELGVIKASGNVTVELKDNLKLSTPDMVEVKIDGMRHSAAGLVYGRVSGERTAPDGSVHLINTSAPPEGRPALKFFDKF